MNPKIRIVDTQFQHTPHASFGCGDLFTPPTYFEWWRGERLVENNDVVILTESSFPLVSMQPEKTKVGLILESPLLAPHIYRKIKTQHHQFDYVLTYSAELQAVDKKFIHFDFGGCWIKPEDRMVHEKTRNISIIASFKKNTQWQKLRHDAIEYFSGQIDSIYGNGYNPVDYKLKSLAPYRFTIITENDVSEKFFTEKLVDAFVTGTFPIYCGSDAVMDIFNIEGMLRFRTLKELEYCLSLATEELYYNSIDAINDNFNRAMEYVIPEDRIYNNFFKPVLGL